MCLVYYYAEQMYYKFYPKADDFPNAALLGDGSSMMAQSTPALRQPCDSI